MRSKALKSLVFVCFLAVGLTAVDAASVELHSVQFPEKTPIDMSFLSTSAAPNARVTAEITYRKGQAKIDLSYWDMKPAILFGGDVTCYVLWAVTRDGQIENLGEFLTRKLNGRLSFSTGKKAFALMVTAESYYLVGKPSELLVFRSRPSAIPSAPSSSFEFADFVPAPRHSMDAVAHIKWDSDVPLELLQARKAFELATKQDAATHTPEIYADAESALVKSNEIAMDAPRSRELLDVARRAVALSNEALNISAHRVEAIELEQEIARRREETAALEQRAAEAEVTAREARELAERAREDAERIRVEKERMVAETAALESEKGELEGAMTALREEKLGLMAESERLRAEKTALEREKTELETESERLLREKSELNSRLEAALSHVAETQESARGFVVNLPDILFDLNEATLKTEARLVLAKLAGIMLIMPDQGALIEGHTDSTGSPGYNLDLSQRRASAVLDFLQGEGLAPTRLRAIGKGMESPVADNTTAEGRKRNRRVEIVITAEDIDRLASN
jgi:outer membrane protein OmpA-like peptidoglycan-associated protein